VLNRDDLIDLIIETVGRHLKSAPAPAPPPVARPQPLTPAPSPAAAPSATPKKGRVFLSEYDIRKRLTPGGRRLTIPKDAIISPLATDWLVLQGIEIVRE
jgi:hypothetical protein